MRKHWSLMLKIGVTVVGLGIVFSKIDISEIQRALAQAHWNWLLAGLVLMVASLFVRAYRWWLLLRGLGTTISFSRLVELYFVGNFFNSFLPTGFGGDVVRVIEVARDIPSTTAAGTVILDRLTGLVMLFVMALGIAPWRPANFPPLFLQIIFAGSLIGVFGGIILVEGRLIRRLGTRLPGPLSPTGESPMAQLLQAVQNCGWQAILQALGVSVLFNLMLAGWWLTNGLALGQQISYSYYLLVMPILSVPLLIPSFAGLGPRELLAPAMFAVVGMAAAASVTLSLLVWLTRLVSGLLGAPVYLYTSFRDGHRIRDKSDSKPTSPA